MIDYNKALEIAMKAINQSSEDAKYGIFMDATIRTSYGWVFFHGLKRKTDDLGDEVGGNSPFIVLESDGTKISLGTYRPFEELLKAWETEYFKRSKRRSQIP